MKPPELPPVDPPRFVKPRKRTYTHYPLIAIDPYEGVLIERTGDLLPFVDLHRVVIREPRSILVGEQWGVIMDHLLSHFKDNGRFQYRVSPRYRNTSLTNGKRNKSARIADSMVSLVGFQRTSHRGENHYHYPINPGHYTRTTIGDIYTDDAPTLVKLLRFGLGVRAFCESEQLKVVSSAGGLAAQLLRDPRFYPEARRKAPKLLNRKAREHLPGNYYSLAGEEGKYYRATYLDMENAHHNMAQRISFPCVNSLHAHGYWGVENPTRLWARRGSKRLEGILSRHGLLHARITVPHFPPDQFIPPYAHSEGTLDAWVYTNELAYLDSIGVRVEGLYASLTSPDTDTGLNRYAAWAVDALNSRASDKPWLKPTLHATYGVLAARPTALEFGFRQARTGRDTVYPMGPALVPVKALTMGKGVESNVVNVLHRGMIEAETRIESMRMASTLQAHKLEVVAIYADSLFVRGDTLPFLPAPWRAKGHLTALRFLSSTQFVSTTLTRLPGLSRELRDQAHAGALITR